MMNLLEVIEFLGYTTAYEPFDKFLFKNGIKKRPNFEDGGFTIAPKKSGLILVFTDDAEENGIVRKSEGSFVLQRVGCNLLEGEDQDRYSGLLPWNLNLKMDRDSVRATLGTPQLSFEDRSDKFCLNGLIVSFVYAKKMMQLSHLKIALPDTQSREIGLCC